jgi:hypothetical protein
MAGNELFKIIELLCLMPIFIKTKLMREIQEWKYTANRRAFTSKLQSPKAVNNIVLRQVF